MNSPAGPAVVLVQRRSQTTNDLPSGQLNRREICAAGNPPLRPTPSVDAGIAQIFLERERAEGFLAPAAIFLRLRQTLPHSQKNVRLDLLGWQQLKTAAEWAIFQGKKIAISARP